MHGVSRHTHWPRLRERLAPRLALFARAKGGAAAVELALVALPFFALLLGVIELSLIFLVSSSLENATALAARTIRTGQLQTGGSATASAFKTTICNNFGWLPSSCNGNLYVDVETFTTFASVTAPQPVTNGVFDSSKLSFSPGNPSDIVVVRAYYQWPLIAPLMFQSAQQLSGGKLLITSTQAFRNEPYGS